MCECVHIQASKLVQYKQKKKNKRKKETKSKWFNNTDIDHLS